jgi:hypothetical protein
MPMEYLREIPRSKFQHDKIGLGCIGNLHAHHHIQRLGKNEIGQDIWLSRRGVADNFRTHEAEIDTLLHYLNTYIFNPTMPSF